jgi:hypothetical protein
VLAFFYVSRELLYEAGLAVCVCENISGVIGQDEVEIKLKK